MHNSNHMNTHCLSHARTPTHTPPSPIPTQNALPDVLAVVQVALEGAISAKAATSSLARGELPQGDLIPWTIGQQYQVWRCVCVWGGGVRSARTPLLRVLAASAALTVTTHPSTLTSTQFLAHTHTH